MKYSIPIIVATGVFLISGYFLYRGSHISAVSDTSVYDVAFSQSQTPLPDLAAAVDASSSILSYTSTLSTGTEEYQNTHYGFSFLYPNNLKSSTFDEGSGASTITFQNTTEVKGFQIFIVPYQGEQVSMTRFRSDEPSNVMEQPKNILVGGAKATMFFSTNATLGDTIEVWVIKNGYLFEITAPKSLAVWLAHIMQTWKFL